LKIYSFNISDEQLSEIRQILTQYFADKNETMDEWLNTTN